jgi:aryl-alcohol dehydrogenase-like predicted oxidoreductase
VPDPWVANRKSGDAGQIIVQAKGREPESIDLPVEKTSFAFEADRCAEAIGAGQSEPEPPAMSWADTLSNMRLLDAWRRELGLSYPAETPEQFSAPLHGGPVRRRDDHPMQYGRIDGVDKPVSRFVMGCDNQPNFAHAAVMYDDWFERGGNAFDTAWIYGRGRQERDLGQWIRTRDVRDQVVLIAKGGHTPACDPVNLSKQLLESLDRLGVNFVEVYVMHRDNPDIPVDEFIDVLNEHHEAGRIGVFGGSNWTLDRIEKANDYASTHGKQPMSLVSNNLSLAEMVKPVWPGCVSCSDAESRQRLSDWQMPLLSWSSQARGYFLEESQRMKLGADNFACWDSPDNRRRRDRAEQLAEQLGVSAMNIAAAYVLNQPFPTFALIGPRQLHEIPTALPALKIELTEQQRRWLNLEVDSPE